MVAGLRFCKRKAFDCGVCRDKKGKEFIIIWTVEDAGPYNNNLLWRYEYKDSAVN